MPEAQTAVGLPDVPEVSDRYTTIVEGFTTRISGIPTSGLDAPSPCTEWTAQDVIVHVVNTHRRVLASLDGTEPHTAQPDDDLASEWPRASGAVREALADPARANTTVGRMFGDQTFESLVGRLLCADTLIHTWDLARATGQNESLDPSATAKALEFLTPIDDAIRRPGGFGAKIEPPAGADIQTRLLNFAGRTI